MAYRQIITKELRLTGSPVASAAHLVWRAPADCRVVALHGHRSGGAAAAVNAQIGSTDVLASNLTCGTGAGTYSTGTPSGDAGRMEAGDALSLEVASGDATTVIIQVDIAVDADEINYGVVS
ncbi:hypothetical protein [Allonocardiopsis opalescens]|uniref:Uncharacterized protein n=1 Tax=Allonocardiopsis opalescens TaxID=1144618 RepID=A0A2T0PSV6_9ACTN|nr:hypothetical protein [Allonocardiopsis opalescens]PRX91979.1 hypothetical protein CLV72_11252 [Allonocardiopsis opalescens]